jgi:hypothetical protein
MGSSIDIAGNAGYDCNASFAEILSQLLNEEISRGRGVSGLDDANRHSIQ